MEVPLTQFGINDLQQTLKEFSETGTEVLSGEISEDVRTVVQRKLRKFKMKEACEMIGRSDAYLRSLGKDDPTLAPIKIGGNRLFYTLEVINKIRDKLKTRYTRPHNSKPIIMAVSNFKGGVGKSTTSHSAACKMALHLSLIHI